MTAIYNPDSYTCRWINKGQLLPDGNTAYMSGWYIGESTILSNDKNANIVWYSSSDGLI